MRYELAAAVLALAGAVAWAVSCGPDPGRQIEQARQHLRRGEEHIEAGRFAEAESELRAALQTTIPERALAYFKLGMACLGLKETERALAAFQQAIAADQSMRPARAELARLYLAAGNGTKAEEQIRALLAADPDDAEAQVLMAMSHLAGQRAREAREALSQALALDPRSAAAHLTLGRLLTSEGDDAAAARAIEEAIALDPARVDGYLALAETHRLRGDWAGAERALQRAAAAAPESGTPQILLGELYVMQGRHDAALALFTKLSRDGPDTWTAAKRLTELYLDREVMPEAQRRVAQHLATNSRDVEAHYLYGRLRLAEGQIDDGAAALERVLRAAPSFVRARYHLGLARLRQGHVESAIAELAECLRYQRDFLPAREALARVYFRGGRFDLARQEAMRFLAGRPHHFEMRLLAGDAALAGGDPEESGRISRELAAEYPDRYESHHRLGRVLARLGAHAAARAALEQALALSPSSVEVLADLVQVMEAAKQPYAERIQRVSAHVDANPEVALARLLLGQLMLAAGAPGAVEILEDVVHRHPGLLPAYYVLGGVYAARGELGAAKRNLERLVERDPSLIAPYVMLGMIEETEGNSAGAARRYQQALALDPRCAPAANNLGWHYAEREDDLDKALELAGRARAGLPDDPRVADTLGWILYRRGVYSAAVGPLREAATQMPENPEVRFHLGMAYLRNGEAEKARDELRSALDLGAFPSAGEARRALAEIG
jgi:tetratricopeptide (TPR) repeat protein